MRWRLLDKVLQLEPWKSACGLKAVSFEEYVLYEPFGREGVLPESLVVESCVELIRWLVAESSDFEMTCLLEEVAEFEFSGEAGMGESLEIRATIVANESSRLVADCSVAVGEHRIARGRLGVGLVPMAESFDVEWMRGRWCELYATA